MKNEIFGTIVVLFVIFVIGSYLVNFMKLLDCDFESPYKCEVVHVAGLFPPLQIITVFADTDEKKE